MILLITYMSVELKYYGNLIRKYKVKGELVILREEMRERRKVDDNLVPLKEKILEQQEQLHDVKVECFIAI
jgi:hypothetical protein